MSESSIASAQRPAVERVKPPRVLVRMANPVLRRLLASRAHPIASSALVLLHLRGRRTGRRYDIPVGYREANGVLTVLTSARWRANLRGSGDIEVTLRGRRRPATATLIEDPDGVTDWYADRIAAVGWRAAKRRLGLRINVGRTPTRQELIEVVRASRLAIVKVAPR